MSCFASEETMDVDERSASKNAPRTDFYSSIYSEIEEVGWGNLVRSADDLSRLTFRVIDQKGQVHLVEISLPKIYPEHAPSIFADVPYDCELQWSKKSRLKDVLHQFSKHVDNLQDFWSTIYAIDQTLCVVQPENPSRACSSRQINLGNDCHLLLLVNPHRPRSLPECRFLGPDIAVDPMIKRWKKNSDKWRRDNTIPENLATLLEIDLPRPPNMNNMQDEEGEDCGICYARYLPVDEELGVQSGAPPDYTCDNCNCGRVFHNLCLRDWLRSITTTRQSFDILFGNCPYCSEPVAVKVNSSG